ncbi:valine--tRNA ligase [Candidatus Woesebacteria bacterium RBG_16_36_11]|uniref:Valine--tRNA ligase n=3 Tax=Candidatus Woeseibacteriota TaxID=1752722 RepID=A0A1F7XB72_9BACT|nr:MAG: valine--tRNA ligase [Candidatus Woesebacteria bacterium RBG_13_36_22]OGM12262.1 MAG: valine--tRNA ligase [Candidatus Woesebacteria bacterium RBG_16_36_11]OGM16320.1 MAG: valine--tRNA ligase [Candidatus Woesebacteria bacterium RBG_19FT_COMBO_37_29]
MDKVWDHKKYESDIYNLWEKSGSFIPQIDKNKKAFCMIMPPPNANGDLHIGHARFVTVEDVITRYHRMKGEVTLWLPGTDHAGIETQYVFEKELAKEGKSRFDFDSDTLYKMIAEYTLKYKGNTEKQLKALGASCDWTREKYTLDADIVKIVYKTFKALFDDGLIYRGERIVNYCTHCGTSYSQLETDTIEKDDKLYYLDYGLVTIATTRPETIFADCAVAVNPKDTRYKKLVGKNAILPIVERELPIIENALVDIEFGTGALKITPAHDAVDFEIGQKNHLPVIGVVDEKGKMINTPEKYIGLTVYKAREEVVSDLQNLGKIKKIENIHHLVAVCYKDKSIIEPRVSDQWFINVGPLAKLALSAIKDKKVTFTAKKFEKIAIHWLKNLKDWNISRQIVWGIRIPAFKCEKCRKWTITEGIKPKSCNYCNHNILVQDTDTFDTWFSSGQWPYATLLASDRITNFQLPISKNKYKDAKDFNYFYPTSIMETAYDILPFWVLRMIMLGLYATGEVPFKDVLLHGLVRDKEGQKISKSKGNVINPLAMIDKYGCDALRMGLVWGALVENDVSLSEENIRGQRNFSNKIWNIGRFVFQNKTNKKNLKLSIPKTSNKEDRWILEELETTIKKVSRAIDDYKLNTAAEMVYDFIWHKFADKYIESIKSRRTEAQPTLEYVYSNSLKILHPFMPYVTEAIWSMGFAKDKKDLIINASWPTK